MIKTLAMVLTLVLLTAFAGSALAAEEGHEVTGTVMEYVAGKSITVQNDNGNYTFDITEDTEIEGDIQKGLNVLIEAEGTQAYFIAMIEREG